MMMPCWTGKVLSYSYTNEKLKIRRVIMKKWLSLCLGLFTILAMPLAHAEGTVARTIVTTAVANHEPSNDLTQVPASDETVMFFTELRGMAGQTIKHRWMHNGEQLAEVSFNVRGARWRVWSSKKMMPSWQGEWTVQVVDGNDQVIAEKSFTYGKAMAEAPMKSDEGMKEKAPMAEEAPMKEQAPMTETAPMGEKSDEGTMNKNDAQPATK